MQVVDVEFDLGPYLSRLRRAERSKPEAERRPVPTQKELAELIDMTPTAFSRLVQNRVGSIDRTYLAAIVHELRSRGFDTDIDDLLRYVERTNGERNGNG